MKLFDFNNIEDTNKLIRYRRMMLWIVATCVFASVALVSGTAVGLAFGFHTFDMIILMICCVFMLITFFPSVFFFVWIDEIEKFLSDVKSTLVDLLKIEFKAGL
jgi:hypothetical protein